MVDNANPIRVALLGAGTVGSATARLIVEQKEELAQRIGCPLELVGVACLNPDEVNVPWIDKSLLTTDTADLCTKADIVIELIGGTKAAYTFVMKAIESGSQARGLLFRGRRGWRNPDCSPAARIHGRRQDRQHHGHCERHYQLYP